MPSAQVVNQWLEIIGQKIGLNLSLEEDNRCVIRDSTKQEFVIEIPEESDLFYLYSPLQALPNSEDRELFYEKILIMNLFGQRTGSATLALDPRISQIVMFYSAPVAHYNASTFGSVLSNFVKTSKRLRETLQHLERDIQLQRMKKKSAVSAKSKMI